MIAENVIHSMYDIARQEWWPFAYFYNHTVALRFCLYATCADASRALLIVAICKNLTDENRCSVL